MTMIYAPCNVNSILTSLATLIYVLERDLVDVVEEVPSDVVGDQVGMLSEVHLPEPFGSRMATRKNSDYLRG